MSGAVGGAPGGRHVNPDAEPIDLDMTPMMNMLIILISFLVTMVVFTHLAVIKFELPSSGGAEPAAAGEAPDSSQAPDSDLTLVISEAGFQIIGEGRKRDPMPRTRDGYDFTALGKALVELRAEFPTTRTVVLLIGAEVLYEDIVATMDVCRDHQFPDVLLSGGLEA